MAAPTPADLAQGVPAGAEIAKRVPAPGGGEYLLDTNGGVYAIGGAAYMGSYHDDNYLDPVHRNDPNRQFYDLTLNEGGGYTLKSDRGWYDLSPRYQELQRQAAEQAAAQQAAANAPAPNSLYTDPAYLNFIRTSDLGIETVADQVRRQNAAIQASLGIDQATRANQGVVEREGIYKDYASRGIARSGGRGVDTARQGQQEANDLARLQSGATERITAGHSQLANAVADRMRQAGELGFDTAQIQDMERRNEDLKKQYPTEFGTGGSGY